MSNFTRKINDFSALKQQLETNDFLRKVYYDLIQTGQAFLAIRDNEATVYFNGNQLCNLSVSNDYAPTIYNHYLPITRSRTLASSLKKESYSVQKWRDDIKSATLSFEDVLYEILDNLKKEKSPESLQASRFYRFSPLNRLEEHDIILLDVEAAFSQSGEATDRIDLVFYHTIERQLMFIEVKRLSDSRLYPKNGAQGQGLPTEVIAQLTRYQKRLDLESRQIREQYNNVINYYNTLSGKGLLPINPDSPPLLGLLLVEFTRSAKDRSNKKYVQEQITDNGFKMYAIGNTANVTQNDRTIAAIYKALK